MLGGLAVLIIPEIQGLMSRVPTIVLRIRIQPTPLRARRASRNREREHAAPSAFDLTAHSPRMKATFDGQLAHPTGADRTLVVQIVAEYPAAGAPDPYYSRHCIPRADAFGSPIL